MVIIFDLDDTLYNEKTFVFSGFEQVANWLASQSSFSKEEILQSMKDDFKKSGRGAIFDNVLEKYHKKNKTTVRKCINIYRLHQPSISLDEKVIKLLNDLRLLYPLYIVTDGHKLVQANKVKALQMDNYVKKVFITYRYGIKASKPSLICFEKIKKLENTSWDQMVYIGDNPKKDFVSLNKVNALTIRILHGDYATLQVDSQYDAKYAINNLVEIKQIIEHENQSIRNKF
jgi:putative hydrolase of the HAD superfamily